jgi:UDP-N-acetyl-D-galactosamine dehydrogenase
MKFKICVIGLGYVGLPLAIEFAKKNKVVGYDIDHSKIFNLKKNIDSNNEIIKSKIKNVKKNILFTTEKLFLKECNVFIITVPTPVDEFKIPDLTLIKNATNLICEYLKHQDTVIYESTVYPGLTEEIAKTIIEKKTKLHLHQDKIKKEKYFHLCYSPERINPSDKIHSLTNITKVISGYSKKSERICFKLYKQIIRAPLFLAKSIKVAEAAKAIENAQRDVNIAFINELTYFFSKINIKIQDVLDAANTKWNFLNFTPGLVGGHCIGVDPYYLDYLAKKNNVYLELIQSSRRINEGFTIFIGNQILKKLKEKKININTANVLILGYTFKENCKDTRNTKVVDLIEYLLKFVGKIKIYDPNVNTKNLDNKEIKNLFVNKLNKKYDLIVLAVKHNVFKNINKKKIISLVKKKHLVYDLKNFLNKSIEHETL